MLSQNRTLEDKKKTIRCTQKVQPTKNVSTGKKRRSTNTPQPLHHMPESSQQSRSSKQKGKKSTTQTPHDSEKPAIARSSNDKRQPSSMKSSGPGIPTDYISLSDSDSEDEFDCKSLDLTLSQSLSQMNPAPGVELCKEQTDLVETIISGKNVFYTGSAGCGKSTVLRSFVRCLRGLGKRVHIVAPTGKAALNVNGSTFWTYAGWTPNIMRKPMKDVFAACHEKRTWDRFNETDVLVIDEISMMENFYFERLNRAVLGLTTTAPHSRAHGWRTLKCHARELVRITVSPALPLEPGQDSLMGSSVSSSFSQFL